MSNQKPAAKRRKYPEIKPARVTPQEAEATARIMNRLMGRDTDTPNVDIHTPEVDINISTKPPDVDINISTERFVDIHTDTRRISTKSDRHRGNRVGLFVRIDPVIEQRIKLFCVERRIDKQDFIERAAIHFIESVDIHKEGDVDILISHDDRRKMIVWKTRPPIINLYMGYLPDNRWKARDDREAERFNDADIRHVELGILHALLRTEQRKIHSFKYFVDEIEEMRAVPLDDSTLDLMLRRRREQWAAKSRAQAHG